MVLSLPLNPSQQLLYPKPTQQPAKPCSHQNTLMVLSLPCRFHNTLYNLSQLCYSSNLHNSPCSIDNTLCVIRLPKLLQKASLWYPAFPCRYISNLVDLNLPLLPSQLSMSAPIPVPGRSHLFGTQHTPVAAKISGWLTSKSCKPSQHSN